MPCKTAKRTHRTRARNVYATAPAPARSRKPAPKAPALVHTRTPKEALVWELERGKGEKVGKYNPGLSTFHEIGYYDAGRQYHMVKRLGQGKVSDSNAWLMAQGESKRLGHPVVLVGRGAPVTVAGNPVPSPVVAEIARQLANSGISRHSLAFVAWDENTLKVSKNLRGALIRYNHGTDLYDVTPYDASAMGGRAPFMSAVGTADQGAGVVWGDVIEGIDVEQLRGVVDSALGSRSNPTGDSEDHFHVAKYDDRATEMGTAYRYGRRAGDARMDRDEARVRFENESYKKWLHLYADVKMRPQLEAEWRRGYTDTMGERRQNPSDSAAAMYETFHGVPSESETIITEDVAYHGHLTQLGKLIELKVTTLSGFKVVLDFTNDGVLLCASENGRQLYFRGGRQDLDLAAIHMDADEFLKDLMVIGDITEVSYETAKKADGMKKLTYFHRLKDKDGAVGTERVYPVLLFDTMNAAMSMAGGSYATEERGLVG